MAHIITSYERNTGMGAHHATQMQYSDGSWGDVSEYGGLCVRREDGFHVYQYLVDTDLWPEFDPSRHIRAYHRSNSGIESIIMGKECLGYQ